MQRGQVCGRVACSLFPHCSAAGATFNSRLTWMALEKNMAEATLEANLRPWPSLILILMEQLLLMLYAALHKGGHKDPPPTERDSPLHPLLLFLEQH